MNVFSEDVILGLTFANDKAIELGQLKVNSALIFDGMLKLLAINKAHRVSETEKLESNISALLKKYNITNAKYSAAYLDIYPKNSELHISETELDEDAVQMREQSNIMANKEKHEISVADYLSILFSDKAYSLYRVLTQVSLNDAPAEQDFSFNVSNFYSEMRDILQEEIPVKTIESLDAIPELTNVNTYVAGLKDLKIVGMKKELVSLEIALSGRTKKSCCIVGPAGTGKTSLVYELANRINKHDETLPDSLKDKIIYELHSDSLATGTMFRGQFEEKITRVLNSIKENKNVILFIDEFHTFMTVGASQDSSNNAANVIKPYISKNEIQIIGATTDEEFNEYVEPDRAISRRLKKVYINPPTKEETIEIMKQILPIDEKYFNKIFNIDLLGKIYELSESYNIAASNPDKALTMLESAFAYSTVCQKENKNVTAQDILDDLKIEYKLNISKTKDVDTVTELKKKLLGQDNVIDEIGSYLTMITENISDPNKPKASLMLLGPTGTGKTETAKIIAKTFTGSDENLIVESGAELQSDTAVNSLFGSDAGYIGYKDTSDFLQKVKQHQNCVILFDEIEKASSAVVKSLLNILDEGYALDKSGKKISFKNAIIIFTSNLGFGTTSYTGSGFMSLATKNKDNAIPEIKKAFSPEFLARINGMIVYNRLSEDIVLQLVSRYLKELNDRTGRNIAFSKKEISAIKDESNIEFSGARNLQSVVMKHYISNVQKIKKQELNGMKNDIIIEEVR